jgi:hypothetical protein
VAFEVDRPCKAPDFIGSLEDNDFLACAAESLRCAKAGHASAHDNMRTGLGCRCHEDWLLEEKWGRIIAFKRQSSRGASMRPSANDASILDDIGFGRFNDLA